MNGTKLSLRARMAILLMRLANVKNKALGAAALKRGEAAYWESVRLRQERAREMTFPASLHPFVIDVDGYPLTRIRSDDAGTEKACFFIHGGGFIAPPMSIHRTAACKLAQETGATIYFVRYPLAPSASVIQIFLHVKKACLAAMRDFGKPLTAVLGDSAGGTLTLALASELDATEQPGRFIAMSACSDISMTNPSIDAYERKDPILSTKVLRLTARRMREALGDHEASPLRMSYENLRRSGTGLDLFVGGQEVLYPDNVLLHERLEREGIPHGWCVEPGLFHIYPLFPYIPECRKAFRMICEKIAQT